jgi:hypothetical protein
VKALFFSASYSERRITDSILAAVETWKGCIQPFLQNIATLHLLYLALFLSFKKSGVSLVMPFYGKLFTFLKPCSTGL